MNVALYAYLILPVKAVLLVVLNSTNISISNPFRRYGVTPQNFAWPPY
jgi:hypothetical protein